MNLLAGFIKSSSRNDSILTQLRVKEAALVGRVPTSVFLLGSPRLGPVLLVLETPGKYRACRHRRGAGGKQIPICRSEAAPSSGRYLRESPLHHWSYRQIPVRQVSPRLLSGKNDACFGVRYVIAMAGSEANVAA